MNPEEEFERWWKETHAQIYASQWYGKEGYKNLWLIAFRLGYHQGMTRAAEICDKYAKEWKLIGNTRANAAIQCGVNILTERDRK